LRVRREEKKVKDVAVNEAYKYSGDVYDFYKKFFSRNSLDDRGMSLISSVHLGTDYNNAFWNGEQTVYGDGDGSLFSFGKQLLGPNGWQWGAAKSLMCPGKV
jgi:Zn-dependent metalloprotease